MSSLCNILPGPAQLSHRVIFSLALHKNAVLKAEPVTDMSVWHIFISS